MSLRAAFYPLSALLTGVVLNGCVGLLTLFFDGCAASPAYGGSTRVGADFSYYPFYDNYREWGPSYLAPYHYLGDDARIDDSRSAHINKPPARLPPVPNLTYDLPPLPTF
jgi:hypothetical protein